MKRIMGWAAIFLVLAGGAATGASGTTNQVMVLFNGAELFAVSGVASLSAESRAAAIQERVGHLARSPLFSTEELSVHQDEGLHMSLIMAGGDLVTVTMEADAKAAGLARAALSEIWVRKIAEAVEQYRKDRTRASYLRGALFALLATGLLGGIWLLVKRLCSKVLEMMKARLAGRKMFKFVDGNGVVEISGFLLRLARFLTMLWMLVVYLNVVLSFFPWTFNLSARMFSLISTPAVNFARGFVANLPNLFALGVIWAIVYAILRATRHIFLQIGEGKVRIRGFYRDWADPTYRLVRLMVIVFALVAAFPYIPGSDSPAFKGISIFMGVLFSLGSTSVVSNIFAGLVLTYMRPFMPGDFVEISGIKGTVMSRQTFSTRIRTPTNQVVSIPNTSVSGNHIVNYSHMAERAGVMIGTTVTIGYDAPWRTVHQLLVAAAKGVGDVLATPAPFVLQTSLDDFYVSYRLVVSTNRPERQLRILAEVHQRIQDEFARAGVEIMSPHYRAERDGTASTIPAVEGGGEG